MSKSKQNKCKYYQSDLSRLSVVMAKEFSFIVKISRFEQKLFQLFEVLFQVGNGNVHSKFKASKHYVSIFDLILKLLTN